MLGNNSTLWEPGTYTTGSDTAVDGQLQHLVGKEVLLADYDYSSRGLKELLSQRTIRARIMRNTSGGLLLPCTVVKNGATTEFPTCVVQAGEGDIGCGVVDPHVISTGVPDNAIFLVFFEGPCKLVNSGDGAFAVGEICVTDASGRVKIQVAAPADTTAAMVQVNSVVGRALEAAAATAALKFRALLKFPHQG